MKTNKYLLNKNWTFKRALRVSMRFSLLFAFLHLTSILIFGSKPEIIFDIQWTKEIIKTIVFPWNSWFNVIPNFIGLVLFGISLFGILDYLNYQVKQERISSGYLEVGLFIGLTLGLVGGLIFVFFLGPSTSLSAGLFAGLFFVLVTRWLFGLSAGLFAGLVFELFIGFSAVLSSGSVYGLIFGFFAGLVAGLIYLIKLIFSKRTSIFLENLFRPFFNLFLK